MEKQLQKDMSMRNQPCLAEPWISVLEASVHLGVKRDTVYKWLERGQIPAHKVGRLWKFRVSEIDSWVVSGKAKARIS